MHANIPWQIECIPSTNTCIHPCRVYSEQRDVCVFLSAWVAEILQQKCQVHDIALGKYCLQPHFMIQELPGGVPYTTPGGDPYTTPKAPLEKDWINSRRHPLPVEGSSTNGEHYNNERSTSKNTHSVWRTPQVECGTVWEKVVGMMEMTKLEGSLDHCYWHKPGLYQYVVVC